MTDKLNRNDPLAAASKPEPRVYYGQCEIDAWWVTLEKGRPKEVCEATNPDRKLVVKATLNPVPEQNLTFAVGREAMNWDRAWAKITRPSILALGIGEKTMEDLRGKWAKAELVPTGETYTKKGSTEKTAETALKFLALYADEGACRAACIAETGVEAQPDGVGRIPGFEDDKPADPTEAADSKERETATQFLNVYIRQHSGDKAQVWTAIQSMPLITEFYTEDSLDAAISAVYNPGDENQEI